MTKVTLDEIQANLPAMLAVTEARVAGYREALEDVTFMLESNGLFSLPVRNIIQLLKRESDERRR